MRRNRVIGAGVAAGAAAGTATAAGVAARQRAHDRRVLQQLLEPDGYAHEPGAVHEVVAEDGVRLHVEVDEPDPADVPPGESRPTVVLCHGFTLDLRSWVLQRKAFLREGYRVVAWDMRGHGRSDHAPSITYDIDECGRDLRRVLDAVAPEGPLALIGHSMGGMTLMALGEEHPEVVRERVVAVAFVATSAGSERILSLGYGEAFGALLARVGPGLLGRLAARQRLFTGLRRIGRDVESYFVERYSFASPVAPATVRFTADMILGTGLDVMADFLPALDALDKGESLAAYRGVEALVLVGADDRLTPPAHSEAIVRNLPGAEHVVVREAGHVLQLEHPHVVSDQLLELVERACRAAASDIDVTRKPRVRLTLTDVARRRRVALARGRRSR